MAVAARNKRPSEKKGVDPKGAPPRVSAVHAAKGKGPRPHPGRSVWEHSKGLLGVVVIFLFIRTFLIEAYRIPSSSMEPTLLVGDFLFVNKLIFGPHIPFTDINLPGYGDPKRGQVAIFVSPFQRDALPGEDPTPTVVKRIVGVGGDTLYMRGGVLYVNGVAQTWGAPPDPTMPDETNPVFDWQKPHELHGTRFGEPPRAPTHDNWGPWVIPPEHLFAMGDNRYNSKDARYYGFVPRKNFRGKPLFIYYSYDRDGSTSPVPFITDIRWGRIGHVIR